MIRLTGALEADIRAEAERAYPNECCGVLFGDISEDAPGEAVATRKDDGAATDSGTAKDSGRRVTVTAILPIVNAREDDEQYHRFEIGPDDYMRAEREARKRGADILGFYHSHPDHPARPSDYDREHALPFYSYIIVAVEKGAAAELTSWELAADRSVFEREPISVIDISTIDIYNE